MRVCSVWRLRHWLTNTYYFFSSFQALITSSTGVYNCTCGGVAYLGVFDDVGDFCKPALIFYDMLGMGDEKAIAETISHEVRALFRWKVFREGRKLQRMNNHPDLWCGQVGHTGGLDHDGTSAVEYYTGHGTGPTGWAPIMGVGFYQPLVQVG